MKKKLLTNHKVCAILKARKEDGESQKITSVSECGGKWKDSQNLFEKT